MLTSSVTLEWPQVEFMCPREEELSAVHDIKRYFRPHSPFPFSLPTGSWYERRGAIAFSARALPAKKAKRVMGTRMIKRERDPRAC